MVEGLRTVTTRSCDGCLGGGKERTRAFEETKSRSRRRDHAHCWHWALMQLWHLLAVACVAADHVAPSAGALPTASRKKSGGKRRAAIGLGVGFAVVPRRAQELYSQYKPRTAEAWRKRMIQRRAIIPLEERAPSIFAVAFTCSVLMVRPPHARTRMLRPPTPATWGERASNSRPSSRAS